MKVFYVDHFGHSLPTSGESDLKRVDKDFVKVNGQLMNAAFVWPDTDENLAIYMAHYNKMKEWKAKEPNMYAVLNKMKRS